MAELTDEEKAKKIFGDVEGDKPDETTEEDKAQSEEVDKAEVEDKSVEEEQQAATTETETETSTETLTKPFPWLKGETPDEWNKELAAAYENSTNEALRIKKERDDAVTLIEEAKRVIANTGEQQGNGEKAGEQPSPLEVNALPEVQYARDLMQRDLVTAFDDFAKQYPQAREPDSFSQIEKASPGAAQAFFAAYGRQATYPELFEKTAALLGWQASDQSARRDAAIKESGAASQTTSSRQPVKQAKISEDQLQMARRLFPNETDEEIVKGLAQYVNS